MRGPACEIADVAGPCSPMMEMVAGAVRGLDGCEPSRNLER
jgi:hypothetical protein